MFFFPDRMKGIKIGTLKTPWEAPAIYNLQNLNFRNIKNFRVCCSPGDQKRLVLENISSEGNFWRGRKKYYQVWDLHSILYGKKFTPQRQSGIQLKESGIPLRIGIRKTVLEFRNPLSGIQNSRQSKIPLHWAKQYIKLLNTSASFSFNIRSFSEMLPASTCSGSKLPVLRFLKQEIWKDHSFFTDLKLPPGLD